MSIQIKQSTMVRPAEETPNKSLWLSNIDMILRTPYSHTGAVLIYKQPDNNEDNIHPSSSMYFDANILIEALSKALVPFYPMAGRLKINGDRYEIDCNAEGALFVEAESSHVLEDFGDFRPNDELHRVMVPTCDYSKGISSFPLLMVQLTRFRCGGVSIGFAQHHHVCDGMAHFEFNNSWARIAKGLLPALEPVHDRYLHLRPRNPPQIKYSHSQFEPFVPSLPNELLDGKTNKSQTLFILSREQINTLKQKLDLSNNTTRLSTYEVVAAHVWRSVSKARGLSDHEEIKLIMPVDGRSRINNPSLPKGYCGNVVFLAVCTATVGDLSCNPLTDTAGKVQEALKGLDDDYLRSAIDHTESKPGLPVPYMGSPEKTLYPNVLVNSWGRIPYQAMDFGWGSPTFFGISNIFYDGQCFLIPSRDGDGSMTLAINLFSSHLSRFKKYFYDF
uniref:Anthranilate N-benzoyltransferase protein 1 n=1 Tax=Dianthus caryophyllus TaxID=3570 RepID=HCBT1_DIACA|nr:RecName: Full=Anthranilate N-benzoyltransferase protein 1; AltName: Full=Anthranilate N-hydroxycinnamoyl/benzoyltransferase 1 [Dianthus caryophyllus]CAB06427.1 anthranilate N-hydroxycinnamoyl/benzoyltransferase [Dianthus caryophyllus]CAB06429.1 anthranilate N-hydroxycinnamoyl/benzoyltransferase [Dianthus caryophyllus]